MSIHHKVDFFFSFVLLLYVSEFHFQLVNGKEEEIILCKSQQMTLWAPIFMLMYSDLPNLFQFYFLSFSFFFNLFAFLISNWRCSIPVTLLIMFCRFPKLIHSVLTMCCSFYHFPESLFAHRSSSTVSWNIWSNPQFKSWSAKLVDMAIKYNS